MTKDFDEERSSAAARAQDVKVDKVKAWLRDTLFSQIRRSLLLK